MTRVLATLVVVQAVPTVLWVGGRFLPLVNAETLAPVMVPAVTPPRAILAAPCEAKPVSQPATLSKAGAAASVPAAPIKAAAPAAAAMLAGHLAVSAPVAMRVFEHGRLIGTTEADTMMMPAGAHDLEFVNDAVGYRVRRAVSIPAGQTVKLSLEAPLGSLNVNAVPWAEVWIDNERIGETPIGNLRTHIGTRQVVFRHPELGERRTTVLVTLTSPARVSMDLRNK
jgi:hypothetical protein